MPILACSIAMAVSPLHARTMELNPNASAEDGLNAMARSRASIAEDSKHPSVTATTKPPNASAMRIVATSR